MIKEQIASIKEVLDRSTIMSIMIISLLASLLSLTIPIAAQTLINLIAFGKLFRPVLTLSLIVFIFMLALGALNVWQIIIAEIIQQKLMVNISIRQIDALTPHIIIPRHPSLLIIVLRLV